MSSRKRRPTTLIFAGVVAILATLSFLDYRRNKSKEGIGENEVKLISVAADDMTSVLIKSKTQTIELKKTGSDWKLTQPFADDTDPLSIPVLLRSLENSKAKKLIRDEGSAAFDWPKYGFDPGVQIVVTSAKGPQDSFSLSETSAFDGSYYVRKGDDLYLGDRSWAHFADKQVGTLRSHMIWRTTGQVTAAEVTIEGKKPIHLSLSSDNQWKAEPPFDLPLGADKVGHWLQSARDLKAADFGPASPTDKDREVALLKKPAVKISYTVNKDGAPTQVNWAMGQEKTGDVFLETNSPPQIYKVSKFGVRDIEVPIIQLLDVSAHIKFPVEEAVGITLVRDGKTSNFVKGDKDWKMDDVVIPASGLADFLQKLRDLDPIASEVPAEVKFDGKNRIVVRAADKTLLNLELSKLNDARKMDPIRWLKIEGVKETFKVSSGRLKAVLQVDFNPKPESKGENKKMDENL